MFELFFRLIPRNDARWLLAKLLPKVSTPLTAVVSTIIVVDVVRGVASIVAAGVLVGAVPGAVGAGFDSPEGRRLIAALAVVVALFLLSHVLTPISGVLLDTFGRRLEGHLRGRLIAASVGAGRPVGIGHLEDPELRDKLSQAQGVAVGRYTPAMALQGLFGVVGSRITAISTAALIGFYYNWWIAAVLLTGLLIVRSRARVAIFKAVEVLYGQTPILRRAEYFLDLATKPREAKETRLFGLTDWIVGRFRGHWLDTMEKTWAERKAGIQAVAPPMVLLQFLAIVVPLVLAGRAAAAGEIDLTALAIVGQSVFGIVGQLFSYTGQEWSMEYGANSVPAMLEFEEGAARHALHGDGRRPEGVRVEEVRFYGVGFRYPGTTAEVLSRLNLTIPAGRSLAIVGANGAGKTTLIKLLCRLYDPTEGRIAVDGVDLRGLDPDGWRHRIGVIFQDFVRYEFSAADNVGFGAVERRRDRGLLERAARRAGATGIVDALPHGWDTVLSREYKRGADLSGGEWQRIALARAFAAVEGGADVLVLDEPTASLDVRAEAEFFDQFLEVTKGTTTILVSHRFSTVRQADVICVLDGGRVAELGSHDELMTSGGRYARMYSLQASHYLDDAPEATSEDA